MTPEAPPATRRSTARSLLLAAVSVHLLVLYLPHPPPIGGAGDLPLVDSVVHVAAFAVVAWTGRLAGVPVAWLLGLLLAHAVLSEAVQHTLLSGRSGEVADVLADLGGLALGLLLPLPARWQP